jgi:hypothetical protein
MHLITCVNWEAAIFMRRNMLVGWLSYQNKIALFEETNEDR